jgi:Uma2 family endonuclease
MSTAIATPTVEHAVLRGVTWETYATLRDDPENDHARMTFRRGVLEIMTLSFFHELVAQIINRLVCTWTEEHRVEIASCGSMTCQREDLKLGLEPDQGYYISHEAITRGRKELNLRDDPPPDLVIEVDHTNKSLKKLPIYAEMGVPEIWRWEQETVIVYRLNDGEYAESPVSECLPGFPLDEIQLALKRRDTEGETAMIVAFRNAVRG